MRKHFERNSTKAQAGPARYLPVWRLQPRSKAPVPTKMSDVELSPKSPRPRVSAHSAASAFAPDASDAFPVQEGFAAVTPLQLEAQPTATDLIDSGSGSQQLILDPATPRTPKHKQAEILMTAGPAAQVLKRHMDAVVKVYCTHTRPNFELPWQVRQQTSSKSTGFAVAGGGARQAGERWILTNAHSITYSSQVQLKRRGDDERYEAKVLAIGTECDIALLTVEDDEFWRDVAPLELSDDLPDLQDSVAVIGYPIGGDSLAISAGVVSRVAITHFSHGCCSLLALQTDASVNSGNSGGPVLNVKGHCVGIAFQSMTGDAQLIGYVIPCPVVYHFVEDVTRNGRFTGFPSLNIGWQELESKALKAAFGMRPHQKGILVRHVVEGAAAAGALRVDDVVLRVAGVEIGCDGTVPFRHGERLDFKHLVTGYFVGDEVRLDILRAGEELAVTVILEPYMHLVPPHNNEAKPSFFMVGGLVFTACSDPYLVQRYGSLSSSPVRLMGKSFYGTKSSAEEEVVVLSNVLATPATLGYDATAGIRDSAVLRFNGAEVVNLAHLARLVSACREEFMRFDMEAGGKVVVLSTQLARQCTAQICERENMQAMSRDIRELLQREG